MNRARIVLLCVLAACGYGVVHDQITVRVCMEHLSVAHPPLFPTRPPTLLALCWGVAATFFIGLAFGTILAVVFHAGPQPPLPAARLRGPVVVLLAAMYLVGLAGGARVCFRAWDARGRPLALRFLPHGRAAVGRTACIVAVGAAVFWWRFRAH